MPCFLEEQHHQNLCEHKGMCERPSLAATQPAQLPTAMNCKTTSLSLTGFSCRGYNIKLDWCYTASQTIYPSQHLKGVTDISRQVSNNLMLIPKYSLSSLQQSLADHLQFGCKAKASLIHTILPIAIINASMAGIFIPQEFVWYPHDHVHKHLAAKSCSFRSKPATFSQTHQ